MHDKHEMSEHTREHHEHHGERYLDGAGDMIMVEMSKHAELMTHGKCHKSQMAHFLKVAEMCDKWLDIHDYWEEHVEDDGGAHDGHHDEVHGELMSAERYLHRWEATKDATYKALAQDELRHAKMLLDRAHGLDAETIKHYRAKYDAMVARVGGVAAMPHVA